MKNTNPLIHNKTKIEVSANDCKVARIFGKDKIITASNLAVRYRGSYKSRYASRLSGDTPFSEEDFAENVRKYPDAYPAFVRGFVKKHPRVQRICYVTKPRLLTKILTLA